MTKRKQRSRRFVITDDLYGCHIFVSAGEPHERALVWFRSKLNAKFEEPMKKAVARSFVGGDKDAGIWFSDPRPGGGVTVHECFHVSQHILGTSGVRLSSESEEAYAYHIDWLIRQVGGKLWQ